MSNSLQILDIGCKFGVHPSNIPLINIAEQILVDADQTEMDYLTHHYESNKKIKCLSYCLTSPIEAESQKKLTLNRYRHPGGNSFLLPNNSHAYWKFLRPDTDEIIGVSEVATITIDNLCEQFKFNPKFLKIDIEGYELNALKGSVRVLRDNVDCLRVEVEFNSLYKDHKPSACQVIQYLTEKGFQFVNLDLFGNSFAPFSDYFAASTYGQLIGCDAIFIRPPEWAFEQDINSLLDYILFLLLNKIEDLAVKLLLIKTEHRCISLQIDRQCPLDAAKLELIEMLVAKIFFAIRDRPRYGLNGFKECWEKIFGVKWIQHGDFYRKYPLS